MKNKSLKLAVLMVLSLCAVSYAITYEDMVDVNDPKFIMNMSQSWKDKRIEYEEWAKGADIAVTLDQHIYPALVDIIGDYGRKKGQKIVVKEGTCGTSSGMLNRKSVDIAGFCCPPGKVDRLPDVHYSTVGLVPLLIIVNSKNPISNLTMEELRALYSGKIRRWSELKTSTGVTGPDAPVDLIGRLHCKSRPSEWRLILKNEDMYSPRMKEVGSIEDMITLVSRNPNAIGFDVKYSLDRYGAGQSIKILSINGVSPSDEDAFLMGKYPLYRIYDITIWTGKNDANPKALELYRYIEGHVKDIKKELEIIPVIKFKKAGWKFVGDELIGLP